MIEGYHHYIYQTPKVDMYRILVLRERGFPIQRRNEKSSPIRIRNTRKTNLVLSVVKTQFSFCFYYIRIYVENYFTKI